MQWVWIITISVTVLVLVIFIIRHNSKDKKNLTRQLNRDYPHRKEEENDIEIDEIRH